MFDSEKLTGQQQPSLWGGPGPHRLVLTCTDIVRTVATMASAAHPRDRWEFRVAPVEDEFVRRAARVSHRTLTDFVVGAAVVEADRVLGDRTRFVLDDDDWNRFIEVVERPPQENPGLTKLFSKPTVFE